MSEKIIGGIFGLESCAATQKLSAHSLPVFLSGQRIQVATGRSAFRLLESHLQPHTVWLPSYLCEVLVRALCRTPIRFYPVDSHLNVASAEWLAQVLPGDAVVFVDYFGFRTWTAAAREVRQRGAWVVEDACPALLLHACSSEAHYTIFSPRKFVGVPDGGILIAHPDAKLPEIQLAEPSQEWWQSALEAARLRAEFDRGGEDRSWFDRFREAESRSPYDPVRMSELAERLLLHALDYAAIARKRRENFLVLLDLLGDLALYPELPPDVVPLGFPVRTAARDSIRQALFAHQIYPPHHWPLDGIVPTEFAESHSLSAEIMTLPCDQRYTPDDMQRVAELFLSIRKRELCG